MTDRSSISNLRITLSVDGLTIDGFTQVDESEHVLNTGRFHASGAKGDVVTISGSKTGGTHTLTRRFDRQIYKQLKAVVNPDASYTKILVDPMGLPLEKLGTFTGVVTSVKSSGLEAGSGEPILIEITFEADGEIK